MLGQADNKGDLKSMSNGSLSDKDEAQSAVDSIASFANNIIAGGSTRSNSVSGSAASQNNGGQFNAIKMINVIAKNTDQKIDNLAHVGARHKSVTKVAVKKYFLHTRSLIRNAVSTFTIEDIIARYRTDLNRILNIIRIDNLYSLIVIKLKDSDLSDSKRELAIREVVNVVKQTKTSISHAISNRMVNDSFVSGINAINGSLSKYVTNNKNNIIKNFSEIISVTRKKINAQENLSLAAKSLANREINQISTKVRHDLRSANNITSVNDIKKHGIISVNRLLTDKDGVLGDLTNFDSFADQARNQINGLTALASNSKQKISQMISHIQSLVDNDIRYGQTAMINFDYQERKIANLVLNQLVKDIYIQLNNFYSYINGNENRQDIVVNRIKNCASKIHYQVQKASGSSIEIALSKGIQSLKSILDQNNYSVYIDSIKKMTKSAERQIRQLSNLSLKDHNQIEDRIQSITQIAENRSGSGPTRFNLANGQKKIRSIENRLHQLMKHSYLKDFLISVSRVAKKGQQQIKNSNLSPLQKQRVMKKVNEDSADTRIKIIRSYKRHEDMNSKLNTGINQINYSVKHSLIDDKNNNFDRIQQVIRWAYNRINGMSNLDPEAKQRFNSILNQVALDSSHRINSAGNLSEADRIEQIDENRIYYQIGRIIGYSDHSKSAAIKLVFQLSQRANHKINFSNLSLVQKRNFNNGLDRHANLCIHKIITTRQDSRRGRRMIVSGIKRTMDNALQLDKKNNLHLINEAAQNAYNNIIRVNTAKINRHEILHRIDNIQLNADRNINNSGSLALVDREEQRNRNLLNETVNKVIGKLDNFKFNAHRKINRSIMPILKQIAKGNYLSKLGKQQTINRIVKVMNDLDHKINEDKDSHIDNDIDYYFDLIYRILKRTCIAELHNIIESAHRQIKKMSALSLDNKNRAIKAVNYINRQTIRNIDQLNNYQMIAEIVAGSRRSIERVIYQISDLDPVKHTAHSLINSIVHNLSEQIRNNHDLKSKGKKKVLKQVLRISHHTNAAINQSDDVYINQIVHEGHQKLAKIALHNNVNANINRINQITQDSKQQIDQMNNLAPVERRKAYSKINRCYHETIHNLNQAKNTAEATRAEQNGENKVNTIYDQIVGSNSFKQAAYDAITKKADDASRQIKNFDNLNSNDKKTGSQLLSRIKKQTIQDINGAYGIHDVYAAENKGTALIRQVINKISSADVMVSAVQSAHERISHSNLGRQQKRKIINQINAMISAGINNQDTGTDHRHHHDKNKQPAQPSDQVKHRSTPHYRYIVHNKLPSGRSRTETEARKSSKPSKSNSAMTADKRYPAGYSIGYRAGLNGKDEHWGGQRSAEYIKQYQKGYRLGHEKYTQAYHSGAKAGRIRGMIAEPMIKLNGLSHGYVDGYVKAYRNYKVTLPVKVYAKKPIYLHRDIYFSPDNRIKKYRRRHQGFKVIKIIRRNDGSLCYKVAGGYITADPAYITNVLASSIPRVVKVINPRGIYVHKSKHFDTGNIMKLLSKGTRIRIADVVQDGNKKRFQLRNGYYITSDRHQVKKAWL